MQNKWLKSWGKSEFWASNGNLESFIERDRIEFNEVCGEAGSVSEEIVGDWFARI
jgi:hypothetical protein